MFIKDEAEKEVKMNEQFDVIVPKFLDEINDRCKSGWLVGDKITIADFFIGGLYINYLTNEHVAYGKDRWPQILEKYPNFKAYGKRYAKEVSGYIASRGNYPI